VDVIPLGIFVILWGNDVDGNAINAIYRPYANIIYTNECGSGPIEFDNSGLGNVNFVSTTILMYFVSATHYPLELLSHHTHNMFDQI